MDVTCERCATEYEFDETLVAARGTTVKCTNCGHLFKVFRPGSAAGNGSVDHRAWIIRRAGSAASETIASLKDLQRRISLGELTPEDEISRGGEAWKRLGDIAELQTFFAAAQATKVARRDPTPAPPTRRDPTGPTRRDPTGPTRRDPTGPTRRDPTGGVRRDPTGGGRAFAPTVEAQAPERPPVPPRSGKGTMLGLGHTAPPQPIDDARRAAVDPGPPSAPPPLPAPPPGRSSPGSVSAPRPLPDSPSSNGTVRSPSARPPALPRTAPPSSPPAAPRPHSSRPPATPAPASAPLPPPPRVPKTSDTASAATPSRAGSLRPLRVEAGDDVPVAARRGRSRSGLWVALVLLLAVAGGVAAGWDRIAALVSSSGASDPATPFIVAGDEALRLDHAEAYQNAIGQYTKALAFRDNDPRALTGLSRAHALIAQLQVFHASDLEARAGADPALRGEAATLRRTAASHANDAREHAEAAARHGGDADAEIALSDALRLAGDPVLARSRLDRARTLRTDPSAEGLRVEALLTADQAGSIASARPLAERAVAEDPGLLRARLVLVRAQLAAGDVAAAQAQLQAVLDRVSDHPEALALRAAIAEGLPPAAPVVGEAAAPPASTDAPPSRTTSSTTTTSSGGSTGGAEASRGYEALVREADQRLENGDTRRARALYEQALRERPNGPEATTGLGFVLLASGDARGALEHFQSAVDRGYAVALIGIGDAYRRLGQRAEALAAYERYLERTPSGSRASIARRQIERLRAELDAQSGGSSSGSGSSSSSTGGSSTGGSSTGGSSTGGSAGGGSAAEHDTAPRQETEAPAPRQTAPQTAPDELPAPRGTTGPVPTDIPAIDSEP